MERQLVQHGASTVMVSLPKKWIDNQKLKRGDKVSLYQYADKLIVSPYHRIEEVKQISHNLPIADHEEIQIILGSLYRQGYQKITLSYNDPKCLYFIQLVTKSLLGFEVMELTERGCIIKKLTEETKIEYPEMLNKVVNIIKAEFSIVKEYLRDGNRGKAYEIRSLRDDCWKFKNVVYNHLKETVLASVSEDYFLIHIIEQNSSFLYWIYRSFDRSKLKKVSPSFIKIYDQIADYFSQSISRMKKKDKDYIKYIMTTRDYLLKECEEYSLSKSPDCFLVLYLSMLIQNIHNPKSLIV